MGESGGELATSPASASGLISWVISCAVAADPALAASGRSWLPQQWSPFACVVTTVVIRASGTASWTASSSVRVMGRVNWVSTSTASPRPVTSPELEYPQAPGGCRYAQVFAVRRCRPAEYVSPTTPGILPAAAGQVIAEVTYLSDPRYSAACARNRACVPSMGSPAGSHSLRIFATEV